MVEYRHLGKPTRRKDAKSIVTGSALYCDDLKIPHVLHARVKRSPHPHAEIIGFDLSKALALKGVRAILTHENAPKWMSGCPAHRLLLDKKVRFIGDAVAILAADTPEIAEEALELIDVEYNVLPAVIDPEEALQDGAPQLYDQFPNNTFPPGSPFEHGGPPFYQMIMGDTEKAFAESAVVAEAKVAYDILTCPGAPETPFVMARWESDEDMTLWGTTQQPNMMKVGAQFNIGARVNAIVPNVGGAYGNKGSMGYNILIVAALAKVTGRAVKYPMSKTEQLISYDQRLANTFSGRIGMTADGIVNAVDGLWIVDTGISSDLAQGQMSEGFGELNLVLSKTFNWNIDSKLVATNRVQSGIVKGFGGQELKSCVMHIWARAMKKLGIDPYECFKKNFNEPGESYYWRDGKQYTNRLMDYNKCFDEAAAQFDWKNKWKGWGVPTSVNGNKVRGVGVGIHMSAEPGADEASAYVRLEFDGTATVHCCVPENGNGQRLGGVKMAAEALNIAVEKVTLVLSESLLSPSEFGLAGSRGTRTTGTAISKAALDAKRILLDRASRVMQLPAEKLDTKDGIIFNKDNPEQAIPWIAVAHPYDAVTGIGEFREDFNAPNCFITFVEVEVDTDTGRAEIVHTLGASDVGQIIDPVQLTMQFHGGMGAAGTNTAQLEEHIMDPHTGRLLTHNLIDYKWRPFNQIQPYDALILESQWDIAPFKAIGMGEITGGGAPAAVLMAIENALGGVEINRYPATPDVILKSIGKA